MSFDSGEMQRLQGLRSQFSQSLKEFASSSATFRVLNTVPHSYPPMPQSLDLLYVLDSSFNPPSRAHLSLLKAALSPPRGGPHAEQHAKLTTNPSSRVLLLLATVNADKKPKPADFEDRLVMMTLMAEELRASLTPATSSPELSFDLGHRPPVMDICVTKQPYFVDKAQSIDESKVYTPRATAQPLHDAVEQIHLVGFDTLIRIFTPKYYPNHHPPLSALRPFLSRHRLRATVRVDNTSGSENLVDAQSAGFASVQSQRAYLQGIANGDMEESGLRRECAQQVDMVVDEGGEAAGVSSTRIREAVKNGTWTEVETMVGAGVEMWIKERGLYTESTEKRPAQE